jgi:hypothetical protein
LAKFPLEKLPDLLGFLEIFPLGVSKQSWPAIFLAGRFSLSREACIANIICFAHTAHNNAACLSAWCHGNQR